MYREKNNTPVLHICYYINYIQQGGGAASDTRRGLWGELDDDAPAPSTGRSREWAFMSPSASGSGSSARASGGGLRAGAAVAPVSVLELLVELNVSFF